jgi:hypothetical protein
MTEAEQIMKRCQVGTRNHDEANNLHAACYGLIGKLLAQRTWVGLTEVDILAASRHWRHAEDFMAGVYWAAGTLKEKNA